MKAKGVVVAAAEAMLVAHGLVVAARIAELEGELGTLRASLRGLDLVWLPGERARPMKLPQRIAGLFSTTRPAGSEARWTACLTALLADPEAPLPD